MTLTEALAGWHRLQIIEHATAQDFAEAFLASPDADDLADDPTQEPIVAACVALHAEVRAC